eukprot:TRINITY_DN1030_c0_g1_i1.p1 TRINITY_DN1030_c0_g1~~TRINITY_DN1030_c0_g1_i1.p1  ORF type:complete len:153 (+),score=41.56 TRINITY_DN1030_c0_g1_i1:423-881(+)
MNKKSSFFDSIHHNNNIFQNDDNTDSDNELYNSLDQNLSFNQPFEFNKKSCYDNDDNSSSSSDNNFQKTKPKKNDFSFGLSDTEDSDCEPSFLNKTIRNDSFSSTNEGDDNNKLFFSNKKNSPLSESNITNKSRSRRGNKKSSSKNKKLRSD